jgi:hypothetical protein
MPVKVFDPDFGKTGFARHLFRLRFRRLKLSQREFSQRFGLSYSVVRDAEQGARPTASLRLIVAAVARDPAFMTAAASDARLRCTCGDGEPYTCCSGVKIPGQGNFYTP